MKCIEFQHRLMSTPFRIQINQTYKYTKYIEVLLKQLKYREKEKLWYMYIHL